MQKVEVDIDKIRDKGDELPQAAFVRREGTLQEAAARFGISEHKLLDFSSNINPLGPSPAALQAAKRSVAQSGCYPRSDVKHLGAAVSRYFGIKPDQVLCGNGASSLLHLIARVFRPRRVLVLTPSFAEYAFAAREVEAEVVSLPLPERTGFRIDPLEMAFALKGVDMAFVCNPNNPTGLLMPKAEMLEIMKYAHEQGVRLVVDEAYMDLMPRETIVKEAVLASHVVCVRTFSTFFGLPGMRVGYAVSDEASIAALRHAQEPWPVNRMAEEAAVAALDDWRHARKTIKLIAKEKDRILSAVRIFPGVEVFPGAADFILIKVPAAKAELLVEKLALRGLFVRDGSTFCGLDSRFIRISVRTRGENKRLIQALRELLS